MTTTFKLQAGELDEAFFKRLSTMFHDREVEIVVRELEESGEYPFDNPVQQKYLDDAIERSKDPKNLITVDIAQLRRPH